jgi:ubiquinone/menaquinone biosynthesis C-methylase UbiE
VTSYRIVDIDPSVKPDIVCAAEKLALPDNSVDTIFSFETLEHVENEEETINEMHRVLRRGGRVILTIPFIAPFHGANVGTDFGLSKADYRRYSAPGLAKLFERHGFKIVEVGPYIGLWGTVAEIIKFLFIDPTRGEAHGWLKTKVAMVFIRFFLYLEEQHPAKNQTFYTGSYIVAEK